MKRHAEIHRQTRGLKKGEFRFKLIGDNGKNVGNSWPETYKRKAKAIQTLKKYFPDFEIVDRTKEK